MKKHLVKIITPKLCTTDKELKAFDKSIDALDNKSIELHQQLESSEIYNADLKAAADYYDFLINDSKSSKN